MQDDEDYWRKERIKKTPVVWCLPKRISSQAPEFDDSALINIRSWWRKINLTLIRFDEWELQLNIINYPPFFHPLQYSIFINAPAEVKIVRLGQERWDFNRKHLKTFLFFFWFFYFFFRRKASLNIAFL